MATGEGFPPRHQDHQPDRNFCHAAVQETLARLGRLDIFSSSDASYFTGQVLHPNGGEVING